ncbi:MAG: hypothetical protein RL318_442 [Fibrobacterota bacterium]|jgi:hypothetical protein
MKRILPRLALVTMALASVSSADFTFVFPTTAIDSAAVNVVTPMRSVDEGRGTTTTLSASGAAIKLTATWGAVPKQGASASILLPMNRMWSPVEFSNVDSVTFSYRTLDPQTTVEFAPISPRYIGAATNNGVMMMAPFASSTSFKTVTVALPAGIAFADWMIIQEPAQSETSWEDVKSEVKALQFSLKPTYSATGGAILGGASASLEIRDVRIWEIYYGPSISWISKQGERCTGKANRLSDFGGPNPLRNVQGGSWFAYTDTASGNPENAKGRSSVGKGIRLLPQDSARPARAEVTANLDKGDSTLHPYAGWAGIGTGFKRAGSESDTALDLSGLKAISFRLEMDSAFDETNLTGVRIRVVNHSVGDSVRYDIGVPSIFNHQEICIDNMKFIQPLWYAAKNGAKPLPFKDIMGFQWEVKIQNDKTAKAAVSSFSIADVKLWSDSGLVALGGAVDGISRRMADSRSSLVANYTNALVLSYALDGAASAKIEVLRMDGRKVASFEATGSAKNKAFPVTLGQGTYLAVVKGAKANLVAPFVVAR